MKRSTRNHKILQRGTAVLVMAVLLVASQAAADEATGPLHAHPTNGRYFTDGSGKAVYLTGSHTWANLVDFGRTDPPPRFDYSAYLDMLEKDHHNFFRLWRWELTKWAGKDGIVNYAEPHPWKRTGPGKTLAGKARFDLEQLDPAYFDRLRERVVEAEKRGIYVSIMLFEGWGIWFLPWDGHPFNVHNNIQEINGDPNGDGKGFETHALVDPQITSLQEAYVRRVIDTVNDLDNVLYEVANESNLENSKEWQYHIINYIKEYEATKPKQHPIGMTGYTTSPNNVLLESPADWVSIGSPSYTHASSPLKTDPPETDGKKVSILDTDHIWGTGGGRDWVWRCLLRGYNPIWMDPYEDKEPTVFDLPLANADDVRRNMGYARRFADRMNLAKATPQSKLCSTGFCLADPGIEYLVYQPGSGAFTVNLPAATYHYEWFNPATGATAASGTVKALGGNQSFTPPLANDAVLYLRRKNS